MHHRPQLSQAAAVGETRLRPFSQIGKMGEETQSVGAPLASVVGPDGQGPGRRSYWMRSTSRMKGIPNDPARSAVVTMAA